MTENIIEQADIEQGDWISFVDDSGNLEISEVLRPLITVACPVDNIFLSKAITTKGLIEVTRVMEIRKKCVN